MMKRIRAATIAIVPMLPPAMATGIRCGEGNVGNECLLWARLLFSCLMIALASTRIDTFLWSPLVSCLSTTIASGLMEKMELRAAIAGKLVADSVSTCLMTKSVE